MNIEDKREHELLEALKKLDELFNAFPNVLLTVPSEKNLLQMRKAKKIVKQILNGNI